MDAFIGEIRAFTFGFVPQGWLACNGAQYHGQSYPALYALLGTRYGGVPQQGLFNVPNLQGITPLGSSSASNVGTISGAETAVISTATMATHNHNIKGFVRTTSAQAASITPNPSATTYVTNSFSVSANKGLLSYSNVTNGTQLDGSFIQPAGNVNVAPHSNMMPFLALTFAINWDGTWPPQP